MGVLQHLLGTSSLVVEARTLHQASAWSRKEQTQTCRWGPVPQGRLVSPLMRMSGLEGRGSMGDSLGSPVDCWVTVGEEKEGQPLNLIPGAWGGDMCFVLSWVCACRLVVCGSPGHPPPPEAGLTPPALAWGSVEVACVGLGGAGEYLAGPEGGPCLARDLLGVLSSQAAGPPPSRGQPLLGQPLRLGLCWAPLAAPWACCVSPLRL